MIKNFILPLFLALGMVVAYAGTNTLSTESAGVIQLSHINKFKTALSGDHVPRNSSGVATNAGASLGTSTYRWDSVWGDTFRFQKAAGTNAVTMQSPAGLAAAYTLTLPASLPSVPSNVIVAAAGTTTYVAAAAVMAGDIKMHHSYNGAADPGEGWMLCDGRQITEAAYNTEHGAGHWATYVGTSPLVNKYLPNFSGKYAHGVAATTQAGTVAITSIGNAGNTINIAHTHTGGSHRHQWFNWTAAGTVDGSFDTNGTGQNITSTTISGSVSHIIAGSANDFAGIGTAVLGIGADQYTTLNSATTDSSLSATQHIEPESIEVQYYMRVM